MLISEEKIRSWIREILLEGPPSGDRAQGRLRNGTALQRLAYMVSSASIFGIPQGSVKLNDFSTNFDMKAMGIEINGEGFFKRTVLGALYLIRQKSPSDFRFIARRLVSVAPFPTPPAGIDVTVNSSGQALARDNRTTIDISLYPMIGFLSKAAYRVDYAQNSRNLPDASPSILELSTSNTYAASVLSRVNASRSIVQKYLTMQPEAELRAGLDADRDILPIRVQLQTLMRNWKSLNDAYNLYKNDLSDDVKARIVAQKREFQSMQQELQAAIQEFDLAASVTERESIVVPPQTPMTTQDISSFIRSSVNVVDRNEPDVPIDPASVREKVLATGSGDTFMDDRSKNYADTVASLVAAIEAIQSEDSSNRGPGATPDRPSTASGKVRTRTRRTVAAGTYVELPNPDAKNPMGTGERFQVTSGYGAVRTSQRHMGVDVAAAPGTSLYASLGGTVTTGTMGGYGCYIDIDQGDGWVARYGHLLGPNMIDDYPDGGTLVDNGATVTKGQLIGRTGGTRATRQNPNPCAGNSRGPHLHFELRYNDSPVCPEDVLLANDEIQRAEWDAIWGR